MYCNLHHDTLIMLREFVDAIGGNTFKTINPNDESVICEVHEARKEDVDVAVEGMDQNF